MTTRTCRDCGEPFETERHWHRLCWDCYWKQRDNGRFANDERGWRQPPPGWSDSPRREPSRAPVELDVRLLRNAIDLTHPDRHPPEREEKAEAVTRWLLDLLRELRKGAR